MNREPLNQFRGHFLEGEWAGEKRCRISNTDLDNRYSEINILKILIFKCLFVINVIKSPQLLQKVTTELLQ